LFSLSQNAIIELPLRHLSQSLQIREVFSVATRDSDRDEIFITGQTGLLQYCGHGLSSGRVIIEGDTGAGTGMEMSGGELTVQGNAEDCLGAAMSGGKISVQGNAGDWCGAALSGESKGMNGGLILVGGNAGSEVGSAMRRGLIAVAGNCKKVTGARMLAGTILCLGNIGAEPGIGMQRGSLVTGTIQSILPGFKPAGLADIGWLRLYLNWLQQNGFTIPPGWLERTPCRFSGDHLAAGKGEILAYEFPQ
jgi:formylmethanofuran dehydrogenase subunit C